MTSGKQNIALIVQRYGAEINGGAETLARMVAERLTVKYNVTVLTSRALDYNTWEPVLPKGETMLNGVKVIRFDHPPKNFYSAEMIHRENRRYRGRLFYQKLYRFAGRPKWYLRYFPDAEMTEPPPHRWVKWQGPATKALTRFLENSAGDFDAFIFFTYLYYPTVFGLRAVGQKSILIPTMHDEKAAYRSVVKETMKAPAFLLFLTKAEKRFSAATFDIAAIPQRVISVGIDPPAVQKNPGALKKFGITKKYVLYAGRIDAHKGCGEMMESFVSFAEQNDTLQLVLVGKNEMTPEKHHDIIYTGFVSDEDKTQLIMQAEALIMPSKYESLSLVLLESFAAKVPVVANGESEVLSDHINHSGGGWLYIGQSGLIEKLHLITNDDANREKGQRGYEYVENNYCWNKTMKTIDDAISVVSGNHSIGSD